MTNIQFPNQRSLSIPDAVEIGESDIDEAITSWKADPPKADPPEEEYTNLLEAEPVKGKEAAEDLPKYEFDKTSQRYRNLSTGRYLSEATVREITNKRIDQVIKDISVIGNLLANGKISVATWESGTRDALKQLHVQQYLLGIGGQKNMTQRDYGIIGNQLQKQYQYLNGFANDLINKGMTVRQFEIRLQLYANSSRQAYERGKLESHKKEGFKWERRRRTKTESCDPCIQYEARGWVAIGTNPEPTQECDCQANCGCYKEYSKDDQKPSDMLGRGWGWVGSERSELNLLNRCTNIGYYG
jgi:hypothetical protein